MADFEVALRAAGGHIDAGAFSAALDVLRMALADGAPAHDCHMMIARAQRGAGDIDPAIDEYLRALQVACSPSEEASALYELGDAYEDRGGMELALLYFQRLARRVPSYDDSRGSVFTRIRRLAPPAPPDDVA